MSIQTALQYLGVAKEAVWGTGVVPVIYIPYDDASVEDIIDTVVDEGRRGVLTKDFNVIRTTEHSEISLDMPLYTTHIGYFLLSLFGDVAVVGAESPYVHTFKVGDDGYSLTMHHFNGIVERQYAGCIVEEISLKGDAESILMASIKLQGKIGDEVSATSASIDTALLPLLGYNASLKVDTVANTNLVSWEVTLKRETKRIHGAATTPDPTKISQGRVSAEFKLTFDVEDETEYDLCTDGSAHALELTFAGSATSKMVITLTAAHAEKAPWDDGDEFLRVDLEGRGVYNVTDGGPVQVALTNATASYTA